MNKLKEIFTDEIVTHLKKNKGEITMDLLDELRSFGNEGKDIALEILDIEKDSENYYLDAFGNRISFNGNRRLKKSFTKMPLAPIHIQEIERCVSDIHYYKDNYVKIRTKSGITFPDMRQYQNDFIKLLSDPNEEAIIGYIGRQSSKTISTSIYLSHLFTFDEEKNIGIVANKGPMAREFLANIKNILIDLPIWLQQGTSVWNKGSIENESKMRILTDVPTQDAFRGFSIHCAIIDECAFIRPSKWEEFIDAFLPSQSALSWKKNIILSTPKGTNHFYDLVKGASPDYNEKTSGLKEPGEAHNGYKLFKVHWEDVPRYKPNGERMKNEDFMKKTVDKHGILYWNQNFGLEFVGSSNTLISADTLKSLTSSEYEELRDGKLKIYEYPKEEHNYIMTVDPSKDGKDAFAVQIIDITDFTFKQVACAQLQIDYLLMPEFLHEWAEFYNNPYLIIENNEGAGQSIADQLYNDYDYENLHFDKRADSNSTNITKSRKRYPGFRTTPKSRRQILQTLKLFIENGKLIINDKKTINEFFQFILINNKYQADDGAHDDMVMSLALAFVPFINTKNFEDMRKVVANLYDECTENEKVNFTDMLTIGDFQSGTDDDYEDIKTFTSIEDAINNTDGFY